MQCYLEDRVGSPRVLKLAEEHLRNCLTCQRRLEKLFPIESVRQRFIEYLDDFNAVDEPEAFLDELSDCYDILRNDICDKLGLEYGSSYCDAAEILREQWTMDDE